MENRLCIQFIDGRFTAFLSEVTSSDFTTIRPMFGCKRKQLTSQPSKIAWTNSDTTVDPTKSERHSWHTNMPLWQGNTSRTQKRSNGLFWPLHFSYDSYDIKIPNVRYLWSCCKRVKLRCPTESWLLGFILFTSFNLGPMDWISRISIAHEKCYFIQQWYHMLSKFITCISHIWLASFLKHIALFQEELETCELMKLYSHWIWMDVEKEATRAELSAERRIKDCPQHPYIPVSLASK